MTTVIYQLIHSVETPIDIVVLKLTHVAILSIALNLVLLGRRYRREYSDLIAFVNHKSLAIVNHEQHLRFRPIRNKIYLGTSTIVSALVVGAFIAPLPYLLETIKTGRLYFSTWLPFDETPYSWSVYLQCAVQLGIIYWMLSYGILFVVIIFEPILDMAVNFKLIAVSMKNLRRGPRVDEKRELQRLKELLREFNELNG